MSNVETQDSELIYELEANPPNAEKFFAALQHVLASLWVVFSAQQLQQAV